MNEHTIRLGRWGVGWYHGADGDRIWTVDWARASGAVGGATSHSLAWCLRNAFSTWRQSR